MMKQTLEHFNGTLTELALALSLTKRNEALKWPFALKSNPRNNICT